jgi:hypothetical protein
MKKLFVLCALAAMAMACGGSDLKPVETPTVPEEPTMPATPEVPPVETPTAP